MKRDSLGFTSFFNMTNTPFTNAIATDSLLMSTQFQDTLLRLEYAAHNSSFAVLTGPVGVGKSTVLRAFANTLNKDEYEIIYISDSNLSPRWLYNIPLKSMGGPQRFYANDAKHEFHDALLQTTAIKHKKVVMIIDEAHLISLHHAQETLQEIRFLLNQKYDSESPLCLILSGQNELWDLLDKAKSYAITQRIDLVCSLNALDDEQVYAYINSHLKYAGVTTSIFAADALTYISSVSKGVPRIINKICTHALLYAACSSKSVITKSIIQSVIEKELPKSVLN